MSNFSKEFVHDFHSTPKEAKRKTKNTLMDVFVGGLIGSGTKRYRAVEGFLGGTWSIAN